MPPRSAKPTLERAADVLSQGDGAIASVCGRYFAMDRDNRWERIQAAFDMMVHAQAEHQAQDAVQALEAAYARDENDEFVAPTLLVMAPPLQPATKWSL